MPAWTQKRQVRYQPRRKPGSLRNAFLFFFYLKEDLRMHGGRKRALKSTTHQQLSLVPEATD